MQSGASSSIDVRKYLFILRRRWLMWSTVALVVLSVGILYCLFWPPVYEAACLVVVQPQKVPGDIVKPTVTTRIEERLQIITQQILSRTRLTELIERFDLYPEKRKTAAPDDLAEHMRKNITIKITRKNYFTISFLYTDPEAVAAVTNAVAAFYVDSNLRLREEDAVGTARFLARELEQMKIQLREWDGRLAKFKEAHLHELPESMQRNVSLLGQLRLRENHQSDIIQNELFRIRYLESELSSEQFRFEKLKLERAQLLRNGGTITDSGEMGTGAGGAGETSPEALQNNLDALKVRYTDDHPDIVRLKKLIERAKKEKAAREDKIRAEAKAKGLSTEDADKMVNEADLLMESSRVTMARLSAQIVEAKNNVDGFKERLAAMRQEATDIQARIDKAPAVGEKLQELSRGYGELKEAYENLNSKYLEAKVSSNLERTQRGEQFEVVDPAQVPDQPFRPNVARAIPVAAALALVLGLGLAFGLDLIDNSFTSVEQTERLTSLPVLVVLPHIETLEEVKARKRRNLTLGLIYSTAFFILLGLMAILVTGRGPALKRMITGLIS